MFDELNGKRVLVTGGATGIGAAIVRRFARHQAQVGIHCQPEWQYCSYVS